MNLARLSGVFNVNFGNFNLSVSYLQAGAILALLFLLVIVLAQIRRHYIEWSFKGGLFGIFFGFLLALILEGFLIVGGKTALTEVVGWKNAPQPILTALDAGRSRLVQVLGVGTEIPTSSAKTKIAPDEVIRSFQSLTPIEIVKVKKIICTP